MMRKFILLVASLFCCGLVAQAQPGVTAQYPFKQAFDTLTASQTIEGQAGWMNGDFFGANQSNVSVFSGRGINNTQSMSIQLSDNIPTDSVLTPLIGNLTPTSEISLYYRIVDGSSNLPHDLTFNGGFRITIFPYDGPNPEPTAEIGRVSMLNHIDSAGYQKITFPLGAYDGKTAYFKFSYFQGNVGDEFIIDMDSVVVNHPVVTTGLSEQIPSTSITVFASEDNEIIFKNDQTAHTSVQIMDLSGKLIYRGQFYNYMHINTALWSKGMYVIKTTQNSHIAHHKILLR